LSKKEKYYKVLENIIKAINIKGVNFLERTDFEPMDLTAIIKRAWRIYKDNLFLLIGIVAIMSLPSALFAMYFSLQGQDFFENLLQNPNPSDIQELLLLSIPLIIYMLVVTPASLGASVKVASEGFLGKKISFSEAYKIGFNNYFAIIIPLILASLLVFFGTLFGLILLIIGSLVVYIVLKVSFIFIVQSVIVDEKKYFSAISRSGRLARKDFWRVLGILIVFLIINVLAELLINIPGLLPVAVLGSETLVAIVFSSLFSFIATILVTSFSYTALTVLYYDLKIRQEGFNGVEESSDKNLILE
jgi:hypothetical protein